MPSNKPMKLPVPPRRHRSIIERPAKRGGPAAYRQVVDMERPRKFKSDLRAVVLSLFFLSAVDEPGEDEPRAS